MPRYKKQISIYVKDSWLNDIDMFARKNEESVSEYIERAISFQLMHDKKALAKEQTKKPLNNLKSEDLLDLPDEDFQKIINEIAKAADTRTKIKIAQTPILEE